MAGSYGSGTYLGGGAGGGTQKIYAPGFEPGGKYHMGGGSSGGGGKCPPGTSLAGQPVPPGGDCSPAAGQAAGANPNAGMGGGGGGGGGVGGPQLPYQPGAPKANSMIDALSGAGQGLLDPNSDYFKQLSGRMSEQMGAQTEAQQRAAALRATRSGLGMGASPELLSAQSEIGTAGMGQMGQAQADLALRAPQVGGQLISPALSGSVGLQGQALSGYMGQQQLAAQQQSQQLAANLQAQQQAAQQQALQAQMQMQAQQMQQQMALRELSALYGGMF